MQDRLTTAVEVDYNLARFIEDMTVDKKTADLRALYQLTNRKTGTSLRLLVDVNKSINLKQCEVLRTQYGIVSLEEFYEARHNFARFPDTAGFKGADEVERVVNDIRKYLTKEELDKLDGPSTKFPTGALDPRS